jgi:hypothetical protein
VKRVGNNLIGKGSGGSGKVWGLSGKWRWLWVLEIVLAVLLVLVWTLPVSAVDAGYPYLPGDYALKGNIKSYAITGLPTGITCKTGTLSIATQVAGVLEATLVLPGLLTEIDMTGNAGLTSSTHRSVYLAGEASLTPDFIVILRAKVRKIGAGDGTVLGLSSVAVYGYDLNTKRFFQGTMSGKWSALQ